MKCVFDSYTDLTNGVDLRSDEVFDNFAQITGGSSLTLADFARRHADSFRY